MSSSIEPCSTARPAGHHLVQLYGHNGPAISQNVRGYLGEGLDRGDAVLVTATVERWFDLPGPLRNAATYLSAIRDGRLVYLDPKILLACVMVDGFPDRDRFDEVVGGMVPKIRARAPTGGLRVYDEMAGVLWQAGQVDAAIRLEESWNALVAVHGFSLWCGYPVIPNTEPRPRESVKHAALGAAAAACDRTDTLPWREPCSPATRRGEATNSRHSGA